MQLRQYANVILKWWQLILVCVILSITSSYLATRAMPRTYLTRTTVMVGRALSGPNTDSRELDTGQALVKSYAGLAKREPVLGATLDALGLPGDWRDLQGRVSTRIVPGTQLLEIAVLDTDPQRAKVLADEIAQQLILQGPTAVDPQNEAERQFITGEIEDLMTNIEKSRAEIRQLDDVVAQANSTRQIQDARDRQAALQTQVMTWQATYAGLQTALQKSTLNFLSVVEPAPVPVQPVAPRVTLNLLLAAAIGLALSCGAVLLYEYIDDTLKTPADVERNLKLMTLGAIARIRGDSHPLTSYARNGYASKLIAVKQPRSPISETFRVLCTNLQSSALDRSIRTLMVTSPNSVEGKSVTAANLAVVMAQSGKRVILVDADLRRPVQHRVFGLPNHVGLTTALLDIQLDPAVVLRETLTKNLRVLPSGPLPLNPSKVLGVRRMGELIKELESLTDVVIFDSAPVMAVADASVLAARVDGTLLVIDSARTRRASAQRSLAALQAVNACVLGVALNRLSDRNAVPLAQSDRPAPAELCPDRPAVRCQAAPMLVTEPSPARPTAAQAGNLLPGQSASKETVSPLSYAAPKSVAPSPSAVAAASTDSVPVAGQHRGFERPPEATQSGYGLLYHRLRHRNPLSASAGMASPVEAVAPTDDVPLAGQRGGYGRPPEAAGPMDNLPLVRPGGGTGRLPDAAHTGPVAQSGHSLSHRRLWHLKPLLASASVPPPVEAGLAELEPAAPVPTDRSAPPERGPAELEPPATPVAGQGGPASPRDEPTPLPSPAARPRRAAARPGKKKRAPTLQQAIQDSLQDLSSQLPPPAATACDRGPGQGAAAGSEV